MELSPFSYKNRTSPLHALSPGVKLVFLLAISSAVFILGFAALIPGIPLILALAAIAGVGIAELLRGSRMLFISALLVLALRSLNVSAPYFSAEGFIEGLRFALSLLFCFASASLFFSVSSLSGILASLSRAELFIRSFFSRLFRVKETKPAYPFLSLAISLMLGFIPRFFSLWNQMETAYTARGGRGGIEKLKRLIPPGTEAMLDAAAETEKALEARGF
ncbi:MAG: energy-coupling factor transporter transmembrane protein EcfT [Spirochaetaceae bacterium]|jgi:biotin transport system permease protein|nr:energy-coupling factor transporter transmembrane protein EcfT [Spirochaetaceae bacterium]